MTTTSWQKLLGLGTAVAFAAAACTVSSGSDDDDGQVTTGTTGNTGGTGGSGGTDATGGTSSTTTSGGSGGSAGDATTTTTTTSTTTGGGSGGEPPEVDCLDGATDEVPGEPASCEVDDDANCCTKCVAVNCCESYSNCFAMDPMNICGGTPDSESDSEIFEFMNCMVAIEGGAAPGRDEGSDFEACIAQATENVSSAVCGNGTISGPTNDLATCMHGDLENPDEMPGCFLECLTDFDGTCAYD